MSVNAARTTVHAQHGLSVLHSDDARRVWRCVCVRLCDDVYACDCVAVRVRVSVVVCICHCAGLVRRRMT